jgi:general secretion pathway protein K
MKGRSRNTQGGVALVMVLWTVMFLFVLVSNFASSMRVQAKIARNYVDQTRAYYLARSGVELGAARIVERLDYAQRHATRNLDRLPEENLRREEEQDEKSEAQVELWRLDGAPNEAEIDNTVVRIYITREEGKIDLNNSNPILLRNLLTEWGLEGEALDIVTDSIADWRDADNLHRSNGAENDYYESLDPPYEAANSDFTSVEDLLRVRGIGPELLYQPQSIEPEYGDEHSQAYEVRLIDCLTVFNSGGAIDVRYASKPVLMALPFMSPALVDRILKAREEVGREHFTEEDLRAAVGDDIYQGIKDYITLGEEREGGYFTIISEAELDNGFILKIKSLENITMGGDNPVKIVQWIDWAT